LVRKKPFVLLRYFLRRARRLVPRFTRAMGFSFFYGKQDGLREREKTRTATGLFPGWF
jgi:hypothetical protein